MIKNSQDAYKDFGRGPVLAKNPSLEQVNKIFAARDLVYPNLTLILLRKGILKGETEEKLIYYDGVESPNAEVTLRLNDMPPGEYYVLYMADFKDEDRFRRLNLNLYSKFL